MKTIGGVLRDLRLSKDLTLAQVAKGIGTYPSSVSDWENNKKHPRPKMRRKMAAFFEVEESYFFPNSQPGDGNSGTASSTVAENIRALRKRYVLSMTDVAKMTDIPLLTISGWENQGREPRKEALEKVANCFNVTVDDLFTGYIPPHIRNVTTQDILLNKVHTVGHESKLRFVPVFSDASDFIDTYLKTGVLPESDIGANRSFFLDDTDAFFLKLGRHSVFPDTFREDDLLLVFPTQEIPHRALCLYYDYSCFHVVRCIRQEDVSFLLPLNHSGMPIPLSLETEKRCFKMGSIVLED